jgi:hypothetical protein
MAVTRLNIWISGRVCHLSFAGNQRRSQFNGSDASAILPDYVVLFWCAVIQDLFCQTGEVNLKQATFRWTNQPSGR